MGGAFCLPIVGGEGEVLANSNFSFCEFNSNHTELILWTTVRHTTRRGCSASLLEDAEKIGSAERDVNCLGFLSVKWLLVTGRDTKRASRKDNVF